MSEARNRLLASRDAASAAKDAFESLYLADRHDLAVGLGVNREGDTWTVQVFASTPAAAKALPDHFHEFAVEVTVTGDIKARQGHYQVPLSIFGPAGGSQQFFMRRDEVEAAWMWADPILWSRSSQPLVGYTSGVWGPSAAVALIERDGRTWHEAPAL